MVGPHSVAEALERISEIHGHLAKGEIYRGFRPVPAAITGLVGIAGAAIQPFVVPSGDHAAFVRFWAGLAAFNLAVHGVPSAWRLARANPLDRRRMARVESQFLPAVVAGAILTLVMLATGGPALHFLPGVWCLLFSLGLFSCRPYLPRHIGWVAVFYLAAGGGLLFLHAAGTERLGWALGAVFGAGQLGAAVALHRDEARHE